MPEAVSRILEVVTISLPLFIVIGLGVVLRRRGMITDEVHAFLSRFVFVICLPVIIFKEVAGQNFLADMSWGLVLGALVPGLITCAVLFLAAWRLPRNLQAPFSAASYFGNTAFIGFPLIVSAFGEATLSYAAVFNAIYLPLFYLVSVLILSVGHEEREHLGGYLRSAVLNPVVMAAVLGVVASLTIHQGGLGPAVARVPGSAAAVSIIAQTMDMVGGVGLVLALLAVGAALHLDYIRGHVVLMSIASAGKLLLMPGLAYLLCRFVFTGLAPVHVGTIVLLSACPQSVGLYVMSQQMETDSDFMAGTLVLSTVLAVVTIPCWLLVLS